MLRAVQPLASSLLLVASLLATETPAAEIQMAALVVEAPAAPAAEDGDGIGAAVAALPPEDDAAREARTAPAQTGAEPELTPQRVREVQRSLRALGFDAGPVDGLIGARTRRAIEAYQQARGLAATGRLDDATHGLLIAEAVPALAAAAEAERQEAAERRQQAAAEPARAATAAPVPSSACAIDLLRTAKVEIALSRDEAYQGLIQVRSRIDSVAQAGPSGQATLGAAVEESQRFIDTLGNVAAAKRRSPCALDLVADLREIDTLRLQFIDQRTRGQAILGRQQTGAGVAQPGANQLYLQLGQGMLDRLMW